MHTGRGGTYIGPNAFGVQLFGWGSVYTVLRSPVNWAAHSAEKCKRLYDETRAVLDSGGELGPGGAAGCFATLRGGMGSSVEPTRYDGREDVCRPRVLPRVRNDLNGPRRPSFLALHHSQTVHC